MIPKKIHQTYHNKHVLPEAICKNIEKIKALNPGWKYYLYDDNDIKAFIKTHYNEEMWKIYNMINPKYGAARADFFRYLLLYIEGGVYLDIKSTILYPLDKLIRSDDYYILSHWENSNFGRHKELSSCKICDEREYLQWVLISEPKHPFLYAIIEYVINNIKNYSVFKDGIGKPGVLRITGPIAYTLAIQSQINSGIGDYREVCLERDFGFIYTIFPDRVKHKSIFRQHYSKIKEPIVRKVIIWDDVKAYLYWSCTIFFKVFKRVKKMIGLK
jgi:mannosyltransferase OCH1-like enzyme